MLSAGWCVCVCVLLLLKSSCRAVLRSLIVDFAATKTRGVGVFFASTEGRSFGGGWRGNAARGKDPVVDCYVPLDLLSRGHYKTSIRGPTLAVADVNHGMPSLRVRA